MLRHRENKEVIGVRQHSFTKGKLCLTNVVTFYNGAKQWWMREEPDVTHLDLCKAMDTVSHDIHISKLERHGFDTRTTWWVRNRPDGCSQRIVVSESMSKRKAVMSGVPC